ncbi:MAG: enoyl-CoA hydratase-related protein [Leptospiraceae bacterium]|nr:enoyl-CoA hydratase-related protein [Leptospiraceae bacterium]
MDCSLEIQGNIAQIQFMRSQKANAISKNLLNEFYQHLLSLRDNSKIYCLVITGTGKFFSAGADLEERRSMSEKEVLEFLDNFQETLGLLESLPVPTIAAINGYAFGGGLEIALACNLRIGKEGIELGLTETRLGIIPGAGGTQRLSRLIGKSKAMSLIFRGKKISSLQAKELGILEEVFLDLEYETKLNEFISEILRCAPIAIRLAKQAIQEGFDLPLKEALELERKCYLQTLPTKDRLEALKAFQEKREPKFTGE